MITVQKASGKTEPFDERKVTDSIQRAGISLSLQLQVLAHVKSKLYDHIPTSEIYHHIAEFLSKSEYPFGRAKYSLKQSIMALGPTGYPFEDFISAMLIAHGYQTKVRQILKGRCVTHEIDVIAVKSNRTAMIEAKFHNRPGTRSEVHVPMYTKSRFDDVKDAYHLNEAWIVTNTKTTTDAIAYGLCVGMKIISWSYPEGAGLRDLIEQYRLHPITMLTTLSSAQKQKLLENHLVLCKNICDNTGVIDTLGLPPEQKEKALIEAQAICKKELI